jgi:poly-gamma-glutamate capsule biosynthesis protein CapA/YwtB (metallophosphatase superfamily)
VTLRVRVAALAAAGVLAVGAAGTGAGAEVPRRSFVIAVAGDIIPHDMLVAHAALSGGGWDFTDMESEIRPWIADADLAICHFEGTMTPSDAGISGYPRFVGPREMADAIASAGWDGCSTASNHAMDGGWDGVVGTLDALDAAGLGHAGTARTPEERLPTFYDIDGVRVAHISYTYGTNGLPVLPAEPWAVNIIDTRAILADAAWAREQGAQFVMVSLHWGEQYQVTPTTSQQQLAAVLLASPDVDIVIGHHAHVVQPIDVINEKYVVYGLGNHLSNQFSRWGPPYFATEDGLLVRIRVSQRPDGTFGVDGLELTPTWVDYPSYRVYAAADALLRGIQPADAIQASMDRTLSRALAYDPPGVAVTASPWPDAWCGAKRASIVGSAGDDEIVGTNGNDVIAAGSGNDFVSAGTGNDLVCGGDGTDVIDGGLGRDFLLGNGGNDILIGSRMSTLIGGDGIDACSGALLTDCDR